MLLYSHMQGCVTFCVTGDTESAQLCNACNDLAISKKPSHIEEKPAGAGFSVRGQVSPGSQKVVGSNPTNSIQK